MYRCRSALTRRLRSALLAAAITLLSLPAAASAAASAAPYIVTVADGVEPTAVAASAKVTVDFVYDATINGFAADLSAAQVKKLGKDSRVVEVEADGLMLGHRDRPVALPPGHDPQITSWGQDRMGLLQSPTAKVDGVDRRRDRVDADVAVIDSGVDASHIDLNVAGSYDCVKGKPNDRIWVSSHGTMVAGFIGAIDNAYGRVGVAPGARIWSVRVVRPNGEIPDSAVLCALEWVRDNSSRIDVANMSIGEFGTDTGDCGRKRPGVKRDKMHRAICSVVESGVTVVAAAGNESMDASGLLPAAYPEVIAVSAFTENDGLPGGAGGEAWCQPGEFDDHIATFSNFGSVVDIAAPGVCVASTAASDFGNYATGSGTSFSAPHVSGAAALVRSRYPWASPARVREILIATAEQAPLLGDNDGIQEPILYVGAL